MKANENAMVIKDPSLGSITLAWKGRISFEANDKQRRMADIFEKIYLELKSFFLPGGGKKYIQEYINEIKKTIRKVIVDFKSYFKLKKAKLSSVLSSHSVSCFCAITVCFLAFL